ncbi:hypothetical protein YC2023_095686 [Brassica napus]
MSLSLLCFASFLCSLSHRYTFCCGLPLFTGIAARWFGIWSGDLLSMEDDCALVVVLRSSSIPPASVSWCQRQVSSFSGSLWLEGVAVKLMRSSGSQCLSLVRVIVVLGCCSLPSSSFPVTASVASISAVRVLVLWFLPCGVSSFYRAGREEQRWLFVVIGVWGFDRLWFVDFAALVRPHCRLLRAPSSRWCLCSLQVEGLRGEVMFWRRVPGQANITGS